MTPTKAIVNGFKNALTFSGRSRRPEYWWFLGFVFAGALVTGLIDMFVINYSRQIVTRVFQLVILLPFLAVAWRRLQDTGRPGRYVLVPSAIVIISAVAAGSISGQVAARLVASADGMQPLLDTQSILVPVFLGLQAVAGGVLLWWMSRPTQRGLNAYGPEPRVR